MARPKIPNALDRRHLLQRDIQASHALEIAKAYLQEERAVEAVDFLAKAEATDELEALLEQATEAGDAFLLRAVAASLKITPDSKRWKRLEAAAQAAGMTLYAESARRQADLDES